MTVNSTRSKLYALLISVMCALVCAVVLAFGMPFGVAAAEEATETGDGAATVQDLEFSAAYALEPAPQKVDGDSVTYTYEKGYKLAVELMYGGQAQTVTVKKDGSEIDGDIEDAGTYTVEATVAEKDVEYTVVIQPKAITAGNSKMTITSVQTYTGKPQIPEFTISETTNADVVFENGKDYTYRLKNNINAGVKTAEIIVAYMGNYSGDVTYKFDIAKKATAYTVSWQYLVGDEWLTLTDGDTAFYYSAEDYSDSVRAVLVGGIDNAEYVYAEDNNTNMYLKFDGTFEGGKVDSLVCATTYTVTIAGYPNYTLSESAAKITLKIAPSELRLGASDFIDYFGDEQDDNRLWVLKTGDDTTSPLIDRATYYDPDASLNTAYGATVTTGALYNAYARYTGKDQTVVLNPDYRINGTTLGAYMSSLSIEYAKNTVVGEENKVTQVTTTAKLYLNGNWTTDNVSVSSDAKGKYIELTKDWYIVSINNALRMINGSEEISLHGWTYGSTVGEDMLVRPEHGDQAIFTLENDSITTVRFAVVYSGVNTVKYYEVKASDQKYVADTTKQLKANYYSDLLSSLNAGHYSLTVSVAEYKSSATHTHWWGDEQQEVAEVTYYPIARTFHFSVTPYRLHAGESKITVEVITEDVPYNGNTNNVPKVSVKFDGKTLTEDEDYVLESEDRDVGRASFVLEGNGNFSGSIAYSDMYNIVKSANSWSVLPSVMQWTYGNYQKDINLISASPTYLNKSSDGLWFKIATDREGQNIASDALREFRLDKSGIVSDDVAAALSRLDVGTYYLFAVVNESSNYYKLAPAGIPFAVFAGVNSWEVTPSIETWTEGGYSATNLPVAKAKFGTAYVTVKDSEGNIVYSSVTGVNKLATAEYGTYTLTAYVLRSNNYTGLDLYTVNFQIYEKPGLPLWATLLIIFGALFIVALVIFILWKKGVFQILTSKLMVKIRTDATVSATIAAVLANKKTEEAKARMNASKQTDEQAAAETSDEAPAEQSAEQASEQAPETATDEKPTEQAPAEEKAEQEWAEQAAAADGPAAEAAESPAEEQAAAEDEKPTEEKPVEEKAEDDKPADEKPAPEVQKTTKTGRKKQPSKNK